MIRRTWSALLRRAIVPIALVALYSAPTAEAQSTATGTLSGRVTAADQRPLAGAAVSIAGRQTGTIANERGEFLLVNVPVGRHTVNVSLIGYRPRSFAVEVLAGATARQHVVLEERAVELEGISVSATLEGQARALNQQRMADNIVSVVSADGIGRFPDLNVADALNRLSGISLVRFRGEGVNVNIRGAPPEFSNVAINGVVMPTGEDGREANLNVMSTDVVGSLEVTKAVTPNMDASSIGGQVNIVTRGALDAGRTRIQTTPAFGRSQLGEVDNFNGSFSIGHVMGANRNVGVLVAGSRSRIGRQLDNVENAFTFDAANDRYMPSMTLTKAYDIVRTRETLSGRLDFAPTDRTSVFATGAHAYLHNAEERHSVRFQLGDGRGGYRAGSTPLQGVAEEITARWNYHDRLTVTTNRSFTVGGRHDLGRAQLDFTGAHATALSEIPPGRMYVEYRTPNARRMTLRYDYANPDFPTFQRLVPRTDQLFNGDGSMVQNPADFGFYEYNTRLNRTHDRQTTGAANLLVPMRLGGLPSTLQLGFKADLRDKDRDYDFFRTRSEPSPPSLSELLGSRINDNFRRYNFGTRFDGSMVQATEPRFQNLAMLAADSHASDYIVGEDVLAGYAMQTVDIGALRLIGGARVEQTRWSGSGWVTRNAWRDVEQVTNQRTETHVFPSLHARYNVTPEFILRAAFTTGINRPSFSNLRPSGNFVDDATVPTFQGSNPLIRPTTSRGLDLMAEYYVPLGVISGGVFYKSLRDVVFDVTRDGTADDSFMGQSLAGYRIRRDENSRTGEIYGFEINLDRPLSFLPAPFNSLGMITNYTYTHSAADEPFGGDRVALASQAAHTANVAGYFDRWGLNARLSLNYQSEYLNSLHEDPNLNLMISGREILDFAATYDVRPGVGIFLEATNLTNSLQRRYRGVVSRVDELEQFGRFFTTGLKLSF
jgi:TonB-dependent receptor